MEVLERLELILKDYYQRNAIAEQLEPKNWFAVKVELNFKRKTVWVTNYIESMQNDSLFSRHFSADNLETAVDACCDFIDIKGMVA